jgi:translation elongation factor EF-Ts
MRKESIDTLDSAQDIVSRLLGWLDELEEVKEREGGITSEWVADATKLVSQANTSLRLVGQLKKEIGVDSQLLLAQKQMDGVMGVLVHVLRDQPQLLDQIELQVAALKPPSHIIEADFEVL